MFDGSPTLSDVLRAAASGCANKTAIVDEKGELTYREFDGQVDALESFLRRIGIKIGDPVAYLLWNQRELLISYHGVTRLGAVTVSLNYRLTASELAHQLNSSGAHALIYDESFLPVIEQALELTEQPLLKIQVGNAVPEPSTHSFAAALSEPVSAAPADDPQVTADHVSGIWFTSGTEGRPKGAVVRHRSAIAAAQASAASIGIHRDCRCLAVAPLFHRGATENIALAVTMVGGTHYLQPRFNAAATLAALIRYDITLAFIVPTMARMLVQELQGQPRGLPHLENWVSASAPMPPALEADVRQMFKLKPGVANCYGITEMLLISMQRSSPAEYDGSVGRPIPTMQVQIYDDARGILPAGEIGEIIARGPLAFSHYLDNPAATEAVRLRIDGADWYRTGDVGRIDSSGSLMILDRRKDMILSGGENIYSAEVEAAVVLHPAVSEVAVVGRKDEDWGEIVVAFIVLRGSELPSLESIRGACGSLASYKHPKEIIVVPALPRNSFGKVQKDVLKQQLLQVA